MTGCDAMAGRRILVTGHTGFKGSWLSLWLAQLDAAVSGFALDPTSGLYDDAKVASALVHDLRGDVRDLAAVETAIAQCRPELVIHLAAQPLVRASYVDPVGTISTNVLGTAHLLDAVRRAASPCPVLVVTTDKVYAVAGRENGNAEDDALGGHDPYSASKAAAEIVAAAWRDSFPQVRVATARAGNVIGGGDGATDRLLPDVVRALSDGRPVVVRNRMSVRPWQHVLDALHGYLLVGAGLLGPDSDFFARAWNFGPLSVPLPVADVVDLAIEAWGSGEWCDGTEVAAPAEEPTLLVDPRRAVAELGWSPRWDIATAVAKTIGWHRAVEAGTNPADACAADIEAWSAAQA